jgi:hypothetical protein
VPGGKLSKTCSVPVKPDLTSVLSFTVVPAMIGTKTGWDHLTFAISMNT